jgi:conjugative relaxase-like TrwC/TraI family protein
MRMMGVDSVRYHRATVLERADDHPGAALAYYAERGESPLVWGGGGALQLDLIGAVTPEHYEAIFGPGGARHPVTGDLLVRTTRPGLELVISAHKSVAELGVIGRAEHMHRILDAERDGTLAYLEDLTQERGGRRGRAATATPTSGLVYAHTRHATSRAGDPCPHDHVLLANLVEMCDAQGGWKAADTALWREYLHAATAYGRLCAAREAVELGYGIVRDDGPSRRLGHWAIAGIPEEAMRVHSKRAQEITAAVGVAAGEGSYRERAIAARRTRQAKAHEPVGDLLARWQRELVQAGVEPQSIIRSIERYDAMRVNPELDARGLSEVAFELLSPVGRLAGQKNFTRRDAVVAAVPMLYGLDPVLLEPLMEAVLASPLAVSLHPGRPGGEPLWAARCVVTTELAIAERAVEQHLHTSGRAVPDEVIAAAIASAERDLQGTLTDSQRRVVEGVCTSQRNLDIVVGVAGAGKTTALDALRRVYEAQGLEVLGTASSGQATRTVGRDAGIEAYTVASLLARLEHGSVTLSERSVLVLDEAGMTSDADVLSVLRHTAAAGAKLLLVGDPRQLSAVGPGGALEAVVEHFGGGVWDLNDNVRQVDRVARRALAELRHGDVGVAADWLASTGNLVLGLDRAEVIGAAVDGWLTDVVEGRRTLMLAWRRANVAALNQLGRQAFDERGWLTGPDVVAPGGLAYRAGDRVVALAPLPGMLTSQTGTVTSVDRPFGSLTVALDDGGNAVLSREMTGSDRLDHAYAVTVHRAQGRTVDTAHYIEDGGGRELAYVALSRARLRTQVYLEADSIGQAIDDLTHGWAIERRQRWITPIEPTPQLERELPARPTLGRSLWG